MGQNWRRVDLGDADELRSVLRELPQTLAGYTLGALDAWKGFYRYEWVRLKTGAVLVSCCVPGDSHRHILQPVGVLHPDDARTLTASCSALPYPLKIYGVTERFLASAPPDFVTRFSVSEERPTANYVYRVEDLATLSGSKYAPKRNHLSRAAREFQWTATRLATSDVAECQALAKQLLAESGAKTNLSMARDVLACGEALSHLDVLGLCGTVIRVDGRVVAFSVWERQTPDTAVVHFERARRDRPGLYQIVNHEAAKMMQDDGYVFVNREEDMGDEGLRKAKQSYYPAFLEKSFLLTFKG